MPEPARLKHEAAYEHILRTIQGGQYAPGDRLPGEQVLAADLGINHLTLRRALARLADEGVIEKRAKVGTFVARLPRQANVVVAFPAYSTDSAQGLIPAYNVMLGSIQAALDAARFRVSLLTYEPGQFWEQVGRRALQQRAAGLLLAASGDVARSDLQPLLQADVPVVLLNMRPSLAALKLPTFGLNAPQLLKDAVKGLAERGHKRIKVVDYLRHPMRGGIDSVITDLKRKKLLPRDCHMLLDNSQHLAFDALDALLRGRSKPTAIVVPDEYAAAAAFRTCYQSRIDVPSELSIVALYDNMPNYHPVPLAAANGLKLFESIGAEAARALDVRLRNEETAPSPALVGGPIRWRDSVAPLAAGRGAAAVGRR